MNNKFADLHCHPSSKSFLTNEEQNKKVSPWKKIRGKLLQNLAPILKSQSNLSQLAEGNVRLAVFPIVPIEKGFSNYWLIRDVLGTFLVLDKAFIREINYDKYSYNELFWGEIEHLQRHLSKDGQSVKILKNFEELDSNPNVINGILSIEGSHALMPNNQEEVSIFDNLEKIKKHRDLSFLYLTLTHLTRNPICNHAFGAKITKSDVFKPHPNIEGIGTKGYEIINQCYDTARGKRILIDIKHMSIYARQKFYDYRNTEGYNNIPIIASHMGVTGLSFETFKNNILNNQIPNYPSEKTPGYTIVNYNQYNVKGIGDSSRKNRTDFNPWSINLYDEEIQNIIDSDGLIGVSLDQRILGFGKSKEEYFQTKEFNSLLSIGNNHLTSNRFPEVECEMDSLSPDHEDEDLFEASNQKGRKRRHLRYFCNNILHIIRIGGKEAWKHICIGSDYDGLIDPINNCKSSADFPDLEVDLIKMFEDMIDEDRAQNPLHSYHDTDLKKQVRDIMYNNLAHFLRKYFSSHYLNNGKIPEDSNIELDT